MLETPPQDEVDRLLQLPEDDPAVRSKQLRRAEPDQINANVSIEQERHGKAFFRFWGFGCWRSAMKSGENLLRLLIKESQDRFHLCWPPVQQDALNLSCLDTAPLPFRSRA